MEGRDHAGHVSQTDIERSYQWLQKDGLKDKMEAQKIPWKTYGINTLGCSTYSKVTDITNI